MPDQSGLLVPLRSTGSALLNAKPIESVRRRLKLASLYFDHVYLEGGTYRETVAVDTPAARATSYSVHAARLLMSG
jgi:hypothetical protein